MHGHRYNRYLLHFISVIFMSHTISKAHKRIFVFHFHFQFTLLDLRNSICKLAQGHTDLL